MERAGYILQPFVDGFLETPVGPVPRVETALRRSDAVGATMMRLGLGRNRYAIAPGLYAVGNPGEDSPVLVTANYKLTFDHLRQELTRTDAWILVLDTLGVNVWCAAGKGTFSTQELIDRVKAAGLERVVRHRKLVLPQLSATGVAAHLVKAECGFRVIWGPVRAADVEVFLENGLKADPGMRRVTFSILERTVLVPVEINVLLKPAAVVFLAAFLLSGIGPDLFSINDMWSRGGLAVAAALTGILCGAVATPILLPWVPGRAFALKGALTGLLAGLGFLFVFGGGLHRFAFPAPVLFVAALSSYLTMNFTGSTPFTSPSGVEKEMRRAIPLQVGSVVVAAGVWLASPFLV
ncbi:MAG: hypothetical protein GY866_34970 [Proteobacteria bacterium]|nr:hypothetical protein [Pseudomonadota bacterium]